MMKPKNQEGRLPSLSALLLLVVAGLTSLSALATAAPAPGLGQVGPVLEGVGMMETKDGAFAFRAAKGWVIDGDSGQKVGLPLVAYPSKGKWQHSQVMVYAQTVPKDLLFTSVDDVVSASIERFQKSSGPYYEGNFVRSMPINRGRQAVIYHFKGGQYARHEAVAFIEEEHSFNLIVLGARNGIVFEEALGEFEQMVSSYRYLAEGMPTAKIPGFDPVIEIDEGKKVY